ncbi:hypothetical protein F4824DRAFT_491363 [Ustulina deusta]|nr:hypothetical protein F4824DRAFT_491363 [Ustulina deusta]
MDHPQMVMTNSECCRDINFNDFRHVADYLVSYHWGHTSNLYQPTFARTKGVRINCYGDQKLLNKPHFEEIELSPMDIILTEHETSDIAKRIGLPIFTKRCSPDPSWANLHDSKIYENIDATYLHLYCRYEIGLYMAHSHDVYYPDEPMSKDMVLSTICRPMFTIRWAKMRDEKHEGGGNILGVPSPYLV